MTMVLLPQLSTYFIHNRVISLDSDLSVATPEKCSHKFVTMTVEVQKMISRWSLGGMGDEDLDEYDAGEDEDLHVFGSLKHCSQGTLDSRTNFGGTSQPWIQKLPQKMEGRGFLPSFDLNWQNIHLPMIAQHWEQQGL